MRDGERQSLCAGIIHEGRNCDRSTGKTGECPILRIYGDQLAAVVARECSSDLDVLSPREQEVHLLLVKGKTNKMIAGELEISERTVEFHRANIMRKMKARSLAELIEKTFEAWGGA